MVEVSKIKIQELASDPAPTLSGISVPHTRGGKTWKVGGNKLSELVLDDLAAQGFVDDVGDALIGTLNGHSMKVHNAGGWSLKNFGTPATGNDWTLVMASAIDSGETIIIPRGTFLLEECLLVAGTRIIGEDRLESIIKLADGANTHVLYGGDTDDIYLQRFTVDGNKANQTLGITSRGVAIVGANYRITARDLIVKNTTDHGFSLSNGVSTTPCGMDSYVSNVLVMDCGSAEHFGAGAPGGSGFAGGAPTTVWSGCNSTRNFLNGFKTLGKHMACNSYSNNGGFETGFGTPDFSQHKYIGCTAKNNAGDGWRNQGQGDQLYIQGCEISGNAQAGIMLFGDVDRVIIRDNYIFNNGTEYASGSRGSNVGYDGIYFGDASSDPSNVQISGNQFWDDQGSPTQGYAVYFYAAPGASVVIGRDNQIGTHREGKVFISSSAGGSDVTVEPFEGCSARYRNETAVVHTGTTSATDLMGTTIKAQEIPQSAVIRGTMTGTVSGTAGTKTIRLVVGSGSVSFSSQTAGETQKWVVNFTISRVTGSTDVMVQCVGTENGGTTVASGFAVTHSATSDLPIKCNVSLGDAGDTVTQTAMYLTLA